MKPFRSGRQLLIPVLLAIIVASSSGAAAIAPSVGAPSASVKTRPTRTDITSTPAWYNPYPNYQGIKMTSANSGWIVGADNDTNPRIKRYYNGSWVDYPVAITNTGRLNAVDATSSEAWVVGEFGTILHWHGSDWQLVSSPAPVTTTLAAVSIVAPGEAWAVGNLATYQPPVILHYQAGSWSLVATPVISGDFELRAMSWASPTDGWLVGDTFDQYGNNHQPLALHYVNGSWADVPLPYISGYNADALSIYMLGASEGWIGLRVTANNVTYSLLHYSGGVWQPVTSAGGSVTQEFTEGVLAFTPGDYYRVYARFPTSGPQQNYFSHNQNDISTAVPLICISGVAADDIWGIGLDGIIYHWDGAQLTPVEGGMYGNRIQMLNSDEGWMQAGTSLYGGQLYHDTAGYWSPTGMAADTFAFSRPDDGWAQVPISGSATGFSHYDGIGWGQTQNATDHYLLRAMQMISSTSGWAVGVFDIDGIVGIPAVAQFNEGSWNAYTIGTGTNADFLAASFTSASDGWAVGYQGDANYPSPLIYHYTNGNWQYITPPSNLHIYLYSVSALSSKDVWMVGYSLRDFSPSYILHWDGSSWTVQQTSVQDVGAIEMLSPNEGWAAGYRYFLHYISGTWEQILVPQQTYNLSFISPTEGWAAGVNGPWRYAARCLDTYGDVPSGYWASTAILYLSCSGIVLGTQPYTFSPNQSASRIQFAKMITLARGWPLITPTSPTFSDVPPGNPLYSFVETAYQSSAISGASAETCAARQRAYPCFLPNDPISRAGAAVITVRAFGWPIDTTGGPHFSDVPTDNYAYTGVETAYHHGVVNGIGGGLFAPNADVTRAQLATILYLALTLPYAK